MKVLSHLINELGGVMAYKLMRYRRKKYKKRKVKKRDRCLGDIKGFLSYIGKSYYQALKK